MDKTEMKPTRNIVKPNIDLWKPKHNVWSKKNDDKELGKKVIEVEPHNTKVKFFDSGSVFDISDKPTLAEQIERKINEKRRSNKL